MARTIPTTTAMRFRVGIFGALLATVAGPLLRAEDDSMEQVIVRVNDVAITRKQVERVLRRVTKESPDELDADLRERLRRATAAEIVRKELARQYLARSQWGATEAEIEPQVKQIAQNLKERGITLAAHLDKLGLTESSWRRQLHWRLAWKRYREHFVTDENLKKFFERHRRSYDGTRLRVAHLWLPLDTTRPPGGDRSSKDAAVARAKTILADIRSGKTTFEAAVRAYSKAPSAAAGGDIGWIERRAPMSEAFSAAAFKLDVGSVSDVVVTPRGLHLIRCLEEKPGKRTWRDAQTELRRDLERYLLDWLADQARKTAKVEWSSQHP